MKTYTYETLTFKSGFVNYTAEKDVRTLIDSYASIGYRYAGYIPTKIGGYGAIREIELIFEKDSDEQ